MTTTGMDADALGTGALVDRITLGLANAIGPLEIERVEFVGPRVGGELRRDGLLAIGIACVMSVILYGLQPLLPIETTSVMNLIVVKSLLSLNTFKSSVILILGWIKSLLISRSDLRSQLLRFLPMHLTLILVTKAGVKHVVSLMFCSLWAGDDWLHHAKTLMVSPSP